MNKKQILDAMQSSKLVPVIRTETEDQARTAIEIIADCGIKVFEITMTVPGALSLMREFSGGELLIGAGTVTTLEETKQCIKSGAQFIVGPAYASESVAHCVANGKAVIPGCLTPSEVLSAHENGADCVKVFPCNALGGVKYLSTLKTLFPKIDMMPTGGVNIETINDYIAAGAFAVGIGSDLVDLNAIDEGNLEAVAAKASLYVDRISNI